MAIGKIAVAAAAAAAAGVAYTRTLEPVPASSSPSIALRRPVDPDAVRYQLPVYSPAPEPTSLVPVKAPLQDETAAARIATTEAFRGLLQSSEAGKDKWIQWEKSIEGNVRSVISPKDQLSPNALYVAVATLAGSIVGRNRGFLLRLALPPTFFLVAASQFLPHSWEKAVVKAEQFEAAHLPDLHQLRTGSSRST
ncbi:hypothetical protein JCM11251_007868 [Rhodosporidiobolus azoricus]